MATSVLIIMHHFSVFRISYRIFWLVGQKQTYEKKAAMKPLLKCIAKYYFKHKAFLFYS